MKIKVDLAPATRKILNEMRGREDNGSPVKTAEADFSPEELRAIGKRGEAICSGDEEGIQRATDALPPETVEKLDRLHEEMLDDSHDDDPSEE